MLKLSINNHKPFACLYFSEREQLVKWTSKDLFWMLDGIQDLLFPAGELRMSSQNMQPALLCEADRDPISGTDLGEHRWPSHLYGLHLPQAGDGPGQHLQDGLDVLLGVGLAQGEP